MKFTELIHSIEKTDSSLRLQTIKTINQQLVIRNWLIGFYIVEFEQKGEERAVYGDKLIDKLSIELSKIKVQGVSPRYLREYRTFYTSYPKIWQPVVAKLKDSKILVPMTQELIENNSTIQIDTNLSNQLLEPENLLKYFTFRHFIALMRVKDPFKRAFYEKEAIKGNWNARFLERQIQSLLLERVGLSTDKEALLQNLQAEIETIEDTIKDPYILEFTGFKDLPNYSENDLESALLDKIQYFLQELGTGFCFEARQKRITIDGEHDRIDLVFYHRILKCHVLIDLKIRAFQHTDSGQMNFYLNFYKNEVMQAGDNPPIGLILCTEKGSNTKVMYSTSGLDNQIFVSKYMVELPKEEDLRKLLEI